MYGSYAISNNLSGAVYGLAVHCSNAWSSGVLDISSAHGYVFIRTLVIFVIKEFLLLTIIYYTRLQFYLFYK